MKTLVCNENIQNFTKGKEYQVKNYDYRLYAVKGDNGKFTVVDKVSFVKVVV